MNYTEWKIPYKDLRIPQEMQNTGFGALLTAILCSRGVNDAEQAKALIDCGAECLCDPFLMVDMDRATNRLRRAIKNAERVAVYGDYDVDGITSSCMLTDYLRRAGLECTLYIPDRIEEGYGLNTAAIEALANQGVSLIVTVDCGVTAAEEAAYAGRLGVDMIITDHHECWQELPVATAVVDPKRPDCGYPNRDLAGVGVAFKLLCALEGGADDMLDRYADLIALGTVADVMPIVGENRYIIRTGLEKLDSRPNLGLRALMELSGVAGKKSSAIGLGFSLAPRLNAAGRLGQVDTAAQLLLTKSEPEAEEYAQRLCTLNRDRQTIEQQIWLEAQEMLLRQPQEGPIVLAKGGWHQGVVGIVASRLTEAYHVPAIMICLDADKGKGSCRSYGGFNLFEALSACSGELEGFGGHAMAAGLTVRPENVDALRDALTAYYRSHRPQSASVLNIDMRVDTPELLSARCVDELERLEPCGNGNPVAMLCIMGARLEAVTPIGGGKHLRLRLEKFGNYFDGVFFSKTPEDLGARPGDWVDVAFTPQMNEFRGTRSVQLRVTDLRLHDPAPALDALTGEIPDMKDAGAPCREDFAQIWRALSACGGEIDRERNSVLETLAPGMWDVKVCVCLRVFQELGLLRIHCGPKRLQIRANRPAGKVDLATSEILKNIEQ